MKDDLLELQPTWRYCRVQAGGKMPYPKNWQHMPLTLDQVDSGNIGLLLGPKGLGVCAIDFDGTTAWTWLAEQGIDYRDLPTTPTWASGKPDRCQMAFTVPEEIWPYLKTKKIVTKQASASGAGDGEGFEFRWAGGQSVIPPSIHPETKASYMWLIKPNIICAELPLSLLELWVKLCEQTLKEPDFSPEKNLDDLDDETIHDIDKILNQVKNHHFVLSYDDWCKVSWATAHHVGRDAAAVLLQKYWPEQKRGEYRRLLKTWNKARSPTIRTLMYMAGLTQEREMETAPMTGASAAKKYMAEQMKYKKLF
jgi:hypothetical protein